MRRHILKNMADVLVGDRVEDLLALAIALDETRAAQQALSNEEAKKSLLAEKQPSMDFATPEQLGALAVFLCSDAAAQVRGAAWNVDGGWYAQ